MKRKSGNVQHPENFFARFIECKFQASFMNQNFLFMIVAFADNL